MLYYVLKKGLKLFNGNYEEKPFRITTAVEPGVEVMYSIHILLALTRYPS
jgi:hypothetical protein